MSAPTGEHIGPLIRWSSLFGVDVEGLQQQHSKEPLKINSQIPNIELHRVTTPTTCLHTQFPHSSNTEISDNADNAPRRQSRARGLSRRTPSGGATPRSQSADLKPLEFPPGMNFFAFPEGFTVVAAMNAPSPKVHSLVLTAIDGSKLYAVCAVAWRHAAESSNLLAELEESLESEAERLFIPDAMVIISDFPFLNMLTSVTQRFMERRCSIGLSKGKLLVLFEENQFDFDRFGN
jgi:hypothetical protein